MAVPVCFATCEVAPTDGFLDICWLISWLLETIPSIQLRMRLMKMKDPQRDSAERHPLESAASEGIVLSVDVQKS